MVNFVLGFHQYPLKWIKRFFLLRRQENMSPKVTTAQLHSTKPELRFCAGSNPARGVTKIRDGEDLWQWSRLEIRLNAFRRSTIPQKQVIIIIIIIKVCQPYPIASCNFSLTLWSHNLSAGQPLNIFNVLSSFNMRIFS